MLQTEHDGTCQDVATLSAATMAQAANEPNLLIDTMVFIDRNSKDGSVITVALNGPWCNFNGRLTFDVPTGAIITQGRMHCTKVSKCFMDLRKGKSSIHEALIRQGAQIDLAVLPLDESDDENYWPCPRNPEADDSQSNNRSRVRLVHP